MVSHVIYSDDGGETWHLGGSVPRPQTTECTAVELSNGDLMLNSRNQNDGENYRVVSISKDGGATFTEVWLETQEIRALRRGGFPGGPVFQCLHTPFPS